MKKNTVIVALRYIACFWLAFHAFLVKAQILNEIPNADFSQWQNNEPSAWRTNNIYDDQGKLLQLIVIPAGNSGAKLVVKKVIHRNEAPAIVVSYGGKLESKLILFMPKEGKDISLTFNYTFKPDSADVLKTEISLNSRNNEIGTLNENKRCQCQFKSDYGDEIMTLPASEGSKSVVLKATFPQNSEPSKMPSDCAMYVWKIRFWLENTSTHLHENTVATIEKIQQP